jgi:hypothetical protein
MIPWRENTNHIIVIGITLQHIIILHGTCLLQSRNINLNHNNEDIALAVQGTPVLVYTGPYLVAQPKMSTTPLLIELRDSPA